MENKPICCFDRIIDDVKKGISLDLDDILANWSGENDHEVLDKVRVYADNLYDEEKLRA